MPDGKAGTVASTFNLEWVLVFGSPRNLVWNDMGPEFVGEEFTHFCSSLGVTKFCGPAKRPEAHGTVENRQRLYRRWLRRTEVTPRPRLRSETT